MRGPASSRRGRASPIGGRPSLQGGAHVRRTVRSEHDLLRPALPLGPPLPRGRIGVRLEEAPPRDARHGPPRARVGAARPPLPEVERDSRPSSQAVAAGEPWRGVGPIDVSSARRCSGRPSRRCSSCSPFRAIFSVPIDAWAFLHALLAAAWGAAVWGLIGGAIARITLVQCALGERLGVGSASRFALWKWAPLIGAPLSPLVAVSLFAALCAAVGLLYRIPGVGPVVGGLLMFLPLLAGVVMTIILLGLAVGWPLMHATIAAEGEDGFDALSRAYAYVNGRPGRYLAYLALAWGLGTIGVVLVDRPGADGRPSRPVGAELRRPGRRRSPRASGRAARRRRPSTVSGWAWSGWSPTPGSTAISGRPRR